MTRIPVKFNNIFYYRSAGMPNFSWLKYILYDILDLFHLMFNISNAFVLSFLVFAHSGLLLKYILYDIVDLFH